MGYIPSVVGWVERSETQHIEYQQMYGYSPHPNILLK
jgi:hypothetical protein